MIIFISKIKKHINKGTLFHTIIRFFVRELFYKIPFFSVVRKFLKEPLNNIIFARQRKKILNKCRVEHEICPICCNPKVYLVTFNKNPDIITNKYFCSQCNHLYLDHRIGCDSYIDLINFFKNMKPRKSGLYAQKQLLEIIVRYTVKSTQRRFLDFGVGGNIGAVRDLNKKYSKKNEDIEFFTCDIFERSDNNNYFQCYNNDEKYFGFFDGIVSNAVVEHLYNTYDVWCYFNKLLKSISDNGKKGIMIHAFPSLINANLRDSTVKLPGHVCLFSKKSLMLICEKTGFEYLKHSYVRGVLSPLYYFRKTRDV